MVTLTYEQKYLILYSLLNWQLVQEVKNVSSDVSQ